MQPFSGIGRSSVAARAWQGKGKGSESGSPANVNQPTLAAFNKIPRYAQRTALPDTLFLRFAVRTALPRSAAYMYFVGRSVGSLCCHCLYEWLDVRVVGVLFIVVDCMCGVDCDVDGW